MSTLSNKALALWGKKNTEDGQQLWLPLIAHLTDTKNVINFLYNQWISDSQRQFLKGNLSDDEVHKLIKFLGFIHDVGKATPAFQKKKSSVNDKSLDEQLIENLVKSGFKGLDNLILANEKNSPHNKAGEAILLNFGVPEKVAALVGGHHGKPESESPASNIEVYTTNYYQCDNFKMVQSGTLKNPWYQVQKELFNYGLEIAGYQSVADIPDNITQPQAVILEGLIIMADWLASSERTNGGEKMFPLIPLYETRPNIDMDVRCRLAMMHWLKDDEWYPQKVLLSTDPYSDRWDFKARPVQRIMTQAIGEATNPGMIIVEAPMGLGKTEIALVAVEQLAYISGADGVFIGLPTQATSNAMFDRMKKWLKKLAEKQKANFSIDLIHSKAKLHKEFKTLPDAENIADDEDSGAVTINRWFSGKKIILNKFSVGTIDNLLLMALRQKHLFLKHLGFSGKVVVIDEVHAYDAYMNQYLYKAITWLGTYHVPIVILSATLPKEKRQKLLQAYLRGKYSREECKRFKTPDNWENNQAYPLLSILDNCELKQISEFPGQSDQKPQELQVKRINLTDEELIADILDKISAGGVAGIIVNTVKRAQTLAKLVEQTSVKLIVLHSAFLAPDRTKHEQNLQSMIGKKGHRPKKLIVIGTQVLEQSLDIDFDVLYTDIAPIDLILQRVGRLHRHHIERPQKLKKAQLFIMGINNYGDYGEANESIYYKYLLMKTDHFLPDKINLPDDISNLVQKVYGEETDVEITGINKAKTDFNIHVEEEKGKAGEFQIKDPSLRNSIHGWLDRHKGNIDKNAKKASAAVRDIQESIEVILLKHTAKGDFLLDERKLEQVPDYEIAEQVIRLPIAIASFPKAIEDLIKELEKETQSYHLGWENNIWLKGILVLRLDTNLSAKLGKWHLQYSSKFGLSYIKEDDHG